MNLTRLLAAVLIFGAMLSCSGHDDGITMMIPPSLESISVSPAAQSMVAGATRQLTATVRYSNGATMDITASVSWSTSDRNVAAVNGGGKVTSVGPGSAEIAAAAEGLTGKASLTVVAAVSPPPLLVTFDLHADPLPQAQSVDQRKATYRQWLTNAGWLLDAVEPYNARVSFLSTGEFLEFCLEDPDRDTACFPVLQRLYASGGVFGTHSHLEWHRGLHDWPDFTGAVTEDDITRNWDDAKAMVDQAITVGLGVADPAARAAINTVRGSHLPEGTDAINALMVSSGFTIREGGIEQELVKYFGHIPFNPYRPGACNLCEDPSRSWMNLPQSTVLGQIGEHYGIWQDGSAGRKQAEILQALVNMRIHSQSGGGEKVWQYGWGVHNSDFDPGRPARDAVQALVPWISSELVPRGEAVFASYPEARDAFEAWEAAHPGESSFSYAGTAADYSRYPYSSTANRFFRFARYDAALAAAGASAYLLKAGNYFLPAPETRDFVLAYADDGVVPLDLTPVFGPGTVRRIRLTDGNESDMPAEACEVTVEPAVFCKTADCNAIASMEDSFLTPCGNGPVCAIGQVCVAEAGLCVPDCRTEGFVCPVIRPTCERTTGVCR